MNILHISYQWPNIIYSNSGIFVKHTLQNLKQNTTHKYFLLISNKVINKDYIKEEKFTAKNYIKFLFNKNFHIPLEGLRVLRRLYFPLLGLKTAAGYNAIVSWETSKRSIMRFVSKNSIKLIHAHFSNPDGYIALQLKKKMKIPYIMHVHGRDVQEYDILTEKEKSLVQEIYKNASHIVCNSKKSQRLLKEITGIYKNTSVIAFGADVSIKEKVLKELHKPIRLLSVGNLVKIKGIQYVLEALVGLKKKYAIKYTVIGDGPMMDFLKQKTRNLQIEDIVDFKGRQNHELVVQAMNESDIFILPSYNEAFGIVYLEAMACGCSVIGVRTQGCEDINSEEECIYLTEPRDVDSIIETISNCIEKNEQREKMKLSGYKVLKNKYSWEVITSQLAEVYTNVKSLNDE